MYEYTKFKAIGLDIWVSFDYLLSKGVPKGTIENGKTKFLRKGSGKWKHLKDTNYEECFFDIKSIPLQTFNKYKLENSSDILMEHGLSILENHSELRDFQEKRILIAVFSMIAENRWNSYTGNYSQYFPDYELINLLGSTHAILDEIIALCDTDDYTMKVLFDAYRNIPITTKLYFRTNSYDVFCKKIRLCKLHSIESVLPHKGLRKSSNNLKLTQYWCDRIITLYSKKSKLTKTKVQEIINKERLKSGLDTVVYSTVNQFINQPNIKNIVMRNRHGRRAAKNNLYPYLSMISKTINEVWEMDGFKLPFCYESSEGIKFLDVVLVVDTYSKKIVGYSVGKNENSEMIIIAICNSIKNSSHLPKEIVHDKHSPYFSGVVEELKEKMVLLQVNWRSTNADSPQEKGTVERVIGILNTSFFRDLNGYIGEGIKSKREYSLPSPEMISELRKKSNLYSQEQVIELVVQMIKEYNTKSVNGKPSPNSVYEQSLSSNKISHKQISSFDFAFLFSENNNYTVRNSMITITRGDNRLNYTLPNEYRNKLNGTKVKVYFDRENYEIIHVFSVRKEKEFYCSIEQDMKVPRRTSDWSKAHANYVNKRRKENKIQQRRVSNFIKHAKEHSLDEQKNITKISRRFLIEGVDDKEMHKDIMTKELQENHKDNIETYSIDVLRKNINDIF